MFLSLTIATIAALIGSSLTSMTPKEDKQEEGISPCPKEDDCGLKEIRISDNENKAYESLSEALFSSKDINKFKEAVLTIESEYYRAEILHGTESASHIFQLIKSRFEQYCKQESLNKTTDKTPLKDLNTTTMTLLDSLKDYVEFIFLKTDKATLEAWYKNHPLLESANSSAKIDTIAPDKITATFKKIFDANNEIIKKGVASHPYCYYDLLNDSGNVYSELAYLNSAIGYISNGKVFNDLIISEIAETILCNTNFYFCRGLTPSVFAKDLKAHIINFLHHNQPIIEENEDVESLADKLDNNYFKNRKIRNYYYFLILCARFLETLKTNWKKRKILKEIGTDNIDEFNRNARKLLFDKIRKYEYAYLHGLSEDNIWSHVLATKAENNEKFNKVRT